MWPALKRLLPPALKARLAAARDRLWLESLKAALSEQDLWPWVERLASAVPDITGQYTGFSVDSEFLRIKVRGQHAFQMELALSALDGGSGAVVDVGDSSGTHLAYLKALKPDPDRRCLSVNLDPVAVEKIKARGFEALQARAEDLAAQGVSADVFLCFETLEHLQDPAGFLRALAAKTDCRRLVLTVPYVRHSRLGLHHIRAGIKEAASPEKTHMFELAPEDLRLLFKHCGWRLERERVYLQYPRRSWLRSTRPLWRALDFEGFYGAVLSRDETWASLYTGWA